jgi:hypothetical protein
VCQDNELKDIFGLKMMIKQNVLKGA